MGWDCGVRVGGIGAGWRWGGLAIGPLDGTEVLTVGTVKILLPFFHEPPFFNVPHLRQGSQIQRTAKRRQQAPKGVKKFSVPPRVPGEPPKSAKIGSGNR